MEELFWKTFFEYLESSSFMFDMDFVEGSKLYFFLLLISGKLHMH